MIKTSTFRHLPTISPGVNTIQKLFSKLSSIFQRRGVPLLWKIPSAEWPLEPLWRLVVFLSIRVRVATSPPHCMTFIHILRGFTFLLSYFARLSSMLHNICIPSRCNISIIPLITRLCAPSALSQFSDSDCELRI